MSYTFTDRGENGSGHGGKGPGCVEASDLAQWWRQPLLRVSSRRSGKRGGRDREDRALSSFALRG